MAIQAIRDRFSSSSITVKGGKVHSPTWAAIGMFYRWLSCVSLIIRVSKMIGSTKPFDFYITFTRLI